MRFMVLSSLCLCRQCLEERRPELRVCDRSPVLPDELRLAAISRTLVNLEGRP
jgi:hypothetical protein